jgi:hypothetical protein
LAGWDGDRTWDLVVSYFGDDPDIFKVDDVVCIDGKEPKWPALYELFSLYPNLATDYDYIWLPDDDLMASRRISTGFSISASLTALRSASRA